ncbi:hypothetical protein EJB05_26778, partial [Eragrostis curvula]
MTLKAAAKNVVYSGGFLYQPPLLMGIDFFIDQGGKEHYDELARRLFDYTKYYRLGRVVLTATPRCGYLDHRLEAALDTGLFDRIHVRLYGEEGWCFQTPLESFKKWAVAYPHSKVSVGVVASPDAAGYMPPWDLYYRVLEYAKKVPNRFHDIEQE